MKKATPATAPEAFVLTGYSTHVINLTKFVSIELIKKPISVAFFYGRLRL